MKIDPRYQKHEPRVPGSRVHIASIRRLAEDGYSIEKIIAEYPTLSATEIAKALDGRYAAEPQFIWGADAIADLIGLTRRQVFHLLENGLIPAKKIGGRWVANREKLIAALSDETIDERVDA